MRVSSPCRSPAPPIPKAARRVSSPAPLNAHVQRRNGGGHLATLSTLLSANHWSSRRRKQEAAEILARQKRELREMTLEEKVIHERMLAEAKLIDRKKALTQKEIIKEKQRKQRDKLLVDKAKKMEENRTQYEIRLDAEVRTPQVT